VVLLLPPALGRTVLGVSAACGLVRSRRFGPCRRIFSFPPWAARRGGASRERWSSATRWNPGCVSSRRWWCRWLVRRSGRGWRMPPTAAHAAADLLLAYPVLAASDPGGCADALMPMAAAEAELLARAADRRDRMWVVRCPGRLPRIWRAIRRARHRPFNPIVCRVARSTTAANLRVGHVPQLIAADHYRDLVASCLPGFGEVSGRGLTAAACARLLGAPSWPAQARSSMYCWYWCCSWLCRRGPAGGCADWHVGADAGADPGR